MDDKLKRLNTILEEVHDLDKATAVLDWDLHTYMPSGGAEDRGDQLGLLARLAHERLANDEVGQLLADLAPLAARLDPESDIACMLRVVKRNYDKAVKVPAEKVAEFMRATTLAQEAWVKARAASNFALFQPHLEHIMSLRREYASYFAPYDHVYDPLLDDFEPGLKTADVQAIFQALRPQQVALIKAIAGKPQVDNSFLHQSYPEKDQWDFGVDVITRFGFDWNRGRIDKTAHPFATSFGLGDVRLTTRVSPNFLNTYLFGTMHECGHGLYEQNIGPDLRRTALEGAASLAIHESQSRLWENLVGRSRPFWSFFYPRLQAAFPSQLGGVPLDAFYKGINKVQPSLIRVEADEATYNLHIMLRLELEIALMDGSLAVGDLPEAWNARMQDYLGITPPNDAQGVLQDVHWSGGMIGYFSTYALGNLVSAQLWEKIAEDMPDIENQIAQGQFANLLAWLREKIHRHGARYEPQDLVQRVTGSKIDPNPYLRYLQRKFGEIYHL
jgi:carboxypeptidase Taq